MRRYQVVVVDLYCMCKRGEETIDHLIMHCSIASELWNLVFPLFGFNEGWWNFWPPGFTNSTSIDMQWYGPWSLIVLFSYVGYFAWKECLYFWRKWEIYSWFEAIFPLDLIWVDKSFGCFFLLFLWLICLVVVIFMLVVSFCYILSTLPMCFSSLCSLCFYSMKYYLLIKKKFCSLVDLAPLSKKKN